MRNEIDAAAAEWVAREDAGPLSPTDAEALVAWLEADSRHLGAYARMHAIMAKCDRLGRGNPASEEIESAASRRRARSRGWRMLAMAASIVVAATASIHFIGQERGTYATRIGEISHVALEDGSQVTLNTDSRIRVRFSEGRRDIQLLRGEAMFDVAKDRSRPFTVVAGDARVVAVGTSFSVRRARAGVDVLVREGIVKVQEQRQDFRLVAGNKALLPENRPAVLAKVDDVEVHRELAWRDGMIAFSGESLRQVAQEFARYNTMHIRIADPDIAGLEVVGLFSATDPIGFSRAVAQSMNLDVTLGDNEIVLRDGANKKNR